jgi:hypothetical protein
MTLTIKDDEGAIIAVLSDESLDMRTLAVGAPGEAPVVQHASGFTAGRIAPVTRPGAYSLFVSVGRRDGTPVIALPLTGDDEQRRYKVGIVTLVESP